MVCLLLSSAIISLYTELLVSQTSSSKRALLVLAIVMIVNALSYGIIIPLLYPYASKFGIGPFTLSLLFTSYSVFQFICTPIIGRLSDKYGRKPLLLFSLLGSSVSLALFASANSILMLFLSRILDGITGGNISVAQAVIADSTTGKDRAKAFGILGASFGIGFILGPAIGGLLSQYGLTVPFWFAAGLGLFGTILGFFVLPETNTQRHQHQAQSEALIDFGKIIAAFQSPFIGIILVITFFSTTAHNAFVLGFQSFSVDVLQLSSKTIGILFAFVGLTSVLMQAGGIAWLLKLFNSKKRLLIFSLWATAVAVSLLFFARITPIFMGINMLYMIVFAPQMVMLTSIISEKTNPEDQGAVLGINQSVMSLGQIFGPLAAGVIATKSIPSVFLFSGFLFVCAGVSSLKAARKKGQFDY